MAKILFINPLVRAEDLPRHVPYGMAMLAAIAMRAGHKVQVYDHNGWRRDDAILKEVMQADDWDVVAAGGITTAYASLKAIFRAAKAYAPQALAVAGGGFITSMPHEIMRFVPEIGVGVVGEAYITFGDLLEAVDAKLTGFDDIPGLIVRRRQGGTELTPQRGLLDDLDSLPYPAWELFPLEEIYFPNSSLVLSEESMTARRRLDINTSYGCSLVCKFCFHLGISGDMDYVKTADGGTDVIFDTRGHYSRNIRYHGTTHIIDMVKYMVDRFDVDFVSFLDENLMTMDQYSGRTWMAEICDSWIAAGLQPSTVRGETTADGHYTGVHWGGTSHATLCNPEILKKMHEAGCSYLDYGWESFSKQVLKTVGKGATPETNIRSYHWTLDAGIRPIPNQIMGFPTEDFDSLRDSMHAWERLGLVAKPFFATPYPGCEWYGLYKDRIIDEFDGDLERFLLDLGDATDVTVSISENFDAVDLYGMRELMVRGDHRRLDAYERKWRSLHGDPAAGIQRYHDRIGAKRPPLQLLTKPATSRHRPRAANAAVRAKLRAAKGTVKTKEEAASG